MVAASGYGRLMSFYCYRAKQAATSGGLYVMLTYYKKCET